MGRIAVPVEKPDNFSPISEIFGRSHFFLVHNSTNNLEGFLRNPFAFELDSGGIETTKLMIENNIDIVLVKQIGANSLRLLTSSSILVYKCSCENANEAFHNFKDGKLSLINCTNKDF
ncbi:MAG: hypothetical protein KKF62_08745 [Bacteroidetes bacterium]|nr:hypothetical protein [Bacteroidota bacterium]MBU1115835.1 hypothetical protein [Bacteroidota bacterium]MBU1800228.1 hypothetical protein [Bacteroidota bacterium]